MAAADDPAWHLTAGARLAGREIVRPPVGTGRPRRKRPRPARARSSPMPANTSLLSKSAWLSKAPLSAECASAYVAKIAGEMAATTATAGRALAGAGRRATPEVTGGDAVPPAAAMRSASNSAP